MSAGIGTWARATRPQFLTITVVAVALGLTGATFDGIDIDYAAALLSLLGALLVHAGANLINDFHDREVDAINEERLAPYTGGSRMIQEGILSAGSIAFLGYVFIALAMLIGMFFVAQGRRELIGCGIVGLVLAVAYSAPPLRLSARVCGELTVAAAWLLVVVGTDFVQRGAWSLRPLYTGLPFACLVAAILWVNEFPDCRADRLAGKRTLVVVWGPIQAVRWHLLLIAATYAGLILMIWQERLPWPAFAGMLAMPWSFFTALHLLRVATGDGRSDRYLPAVKATVLAAHVHGTALAAGLLFAAALP